MTGLRFGTLLFLGALFLPAQDLREYERKVTEFTLSNGLHFILLERHQVPVVSFHTYVNVGSAQDPGGQTGMAKLLERMAFKGTESIGTKNWGVEKRALEDLDEAYTRLVAEGNKGSKASQVRIVSLEADLRAAVQAAQNQDDSSEFTRVIQENGGVGLNSQTTPDASETSYCLPSNRIELWFLMESQRLGHPVFRNFYREREALHAESQDVDSKPLPKLQQALLATAFAAHPYRNPGVGWPGDVTSLMPADARAFYNTYYVPGNMVMGIVGDVDPANAQRLAERYFGNLPAKPSPPMLHTQEPPQTGPKTVVLLANANTPPLLLIGYKRPDQTNRDDLAFDVIRMILAESRTGWLYKELVEGKKIAQAIDATATFPAGRYNNLFVFSVAPAKDHTLEENRSAVEELLARFQAKPVDAETLTRVKNVVRGRIARLLGSNQQLASLLPTYYANYGDWRKLFTTISDLNHLNPEDVQRVATQYFTPANRTVAYLTNMADRVPFASVEKGAR